MLGYIISSEEKINVKENEIQSFDILNKMNLNIFVVENNKVLYKNDIIFNASINGHVEILEWFKKSGYEFNLDCIECGIKQASRCGHVKILEWFKNSGYEFKYTEHAICLASLNGHIKVLDWFKNYGFEFKYIKTAINYSTISGNIKILKWF
jgi:ankyrin repeat protein